MFCNLWRFKTHTCCRSTLRWMEEHVHSSKVLSVSIIVLCMSPVSHSGKRTSSALICEPGRGWSSWSELVCFACRTILFHWTWRIRTRVVVACYSSRESLNRALMFPLTDILMTFILKLKVQEHYCHLLDLEWASLSFRFHRCRHGPWSTDPFCMKI